jgi:hypothetical protein
MYNKANIPLIRPVGPEVIRMSNRFLEALEVNDHEIMVSLATRVHNNQSFNASMRINFPSVYQKMQEVYDMALTPKVRSVEVPE